MRNIIKRLLVLLLVAGSVYGISQTGAWFTAKEEVLGNSIDTGTIDIAVGESQELPYKLEDLKPSQNGYINVIVQNVGTNPLNLFNTLSNPVTSDNLVSEPECLAEGGTWGGYQEESDHIGICTGARVEVSDLDNKINFDLRVELYPGNPDDSTAVWWETIYLDSDNVKMSDINNVYLGMVPAGWYMKVMQSYHLPGEEVGNEYQGDMITFDMVFDAEQFGKSKLVLENKYEADGDLSHHLHDTIYGILGYTIKDRSFDYSLDLYGKPVGDYTLVSWENTSTFPEAWEWGDFEGTTILAQFSYDGTNPVTGSIDLDKNIINAKVWLIPGNLGTAGTEGISLPWSGVSNYLFETGLMDYYDSDL